MTAHEPLRRLATAAALTLLALALSGCLIADALVRLAYDPARDEFRQLIVYERFRARNDKIGEGPAAKPEYDWDKDFAELKRMWVGRNKMILLEPSIQRMFGMIAHAERSDTGALIGGWKKDGDADEPAVDWADVRVHPGQLFKDADGYVGYYHEMTIPGKVVDQLLKVVVFHASKNEDVKKGLTDELARRDQGGQRLAWKDLVDRTTADLRRRPTDPPANVEPQTDPEARPNDIQRYLDAASLKALVATLKAGTLDLTRAGSKVSLRLPLSDDDAKNLATLITEARKAAAAAAELPGEDPTAAAQRKRIAQILGQTQAETLPKSAGLRLTIDLPPFLNATCDAAREAARADFKTNATDQKMAKAMADRATTELKPRTDIKVDQLIAEFEARKSAR